MKSFIMCVVGLFFSISLFGQNAETILQKVDDNMSARNRVFESEMTIHGKRSSRAVRSKTYAEGVEKSFTVYLSPPAEKGTKMLKLGKQMWLYAPATDRTIQLSGHMLRQSVMGSDLSYEDMMEDRKLSEVYDAEMGGEEILNDRKTFILVLSARVADLAYQSQKIWVDAERFVPLRQELFAKGGKLLKRTEMSDVQRIQGRWFPMTITYKDMLKEGQGTVFTIHNIQFDQAIPDHIFNKAALRD